MSYEELLEVEVIRLRESLTIDLGILNKMNPVSETSPVKISRYLKCDVLRNRDDVEPYGFAATYTEDEIIELAMKHGSKIVVKNGHKGKWYLKGKGKTAEYLQTKIDKGIGKFRDGVYCLLLEY